MKIAIIGANGQLGSDLCWVLGGQNVSVFPLLHRDLDVTNPVQVNQCWAPSSQT